MKMLITIMLLMGSCAAWSSSPSRRSFLDQVAASTTAIVGGMSLAATNNLQPAIAVSGLNKVNARLAGFGLVPYEGLPDGFTVLSEIWGRGKNRFPLLVSFAHPITWVVTLPSNNVNGEDGTVQAGDYNKGDTATLYVYSEPGHVGSIASAPKELFEKALIKSISQKGDNIYQNFKITKLTPETIGKQEYMRADFKYTLLTGAGFEVDRKGFASITSEGPAVEVLWTATIESRFKKMEPVLKDIVASFRCYADGLNLSDDLYVDPSTTSAV
ncbi:hypothetical protein MPSEU_000138800 [Mayamaea pseudoterrestris]|nr:hypothetical protein MPSEU_000138800 [Mayamaea pseudoterrestris]